MSETKALFSATLERIIEALTLEEIEGPDGGALMTLQSEMGPAPVGSVRVFEGGGLERLVAVSLEVPMIPIDSHMLFAFTPAESAVPHFTVDSVRAQDVLAFHLDLIPRADLGANLAYMDAAYGPLTESFMTGDGFEGFSAARLTPRQLALMSPWMLAKRVAPEAFARVGDFVDTYCAHWLSLLDSGMSDEVTAELSGEALALRDRRNRAALFNPDVDPVWANVARLVGEPTAARVRELLRGDR